MPFKSEPFRAADHFRPRRHALALEQRILFDGAAAAAVDHQHHSDPASSASASGATPDSSRHASAANADARATTPARATPPAPNASPPAPPSAAIHQNLVILDSRVDNGSELLSNLRSNTRVLIIDPGQDAVSAISAALVSMGKVDSIQIFSHGASGQFTLGDQTFTSASIAQMVGTLGAWRTGLNADADIELYGCNVGAGATGKALVQELASVTGATVGASNNNTGSAAYGGDWTLEVASGVLDKPIALSADALSHFNSLLADASPTTTISESGQNVLLGNQFSFDVSFSNSSTQVGYAPYIDLLMPATGKDGNDGASFVSATYLGQTVTSFVITFDANGNAVHPLAKDASGNPLVVNAATYGLHAGDQLVVLELPFGSVSQGQPAITVQVTAKLSDLADTAFSNSTPDLTIQARGGFQFGNDQLDNPTVDPTLVEASLHDLVVHPTVVTLTQGVNMTEGETVSGPNYVHTETVTATPAPGQTLTDVTVTQDIPANVQVTAITPGAGGMVKSLTLQDGSVLTNPAAIAAAIASDSIFIRSYSVEYATLSAPENTVVSFYVPQTDAFGQPVIDPVSGAPVTIAFGTASGSGEWVPLDPRDLTPPATSIDFSGTADGTGTTFVAKSVTLEKQVTDQIDTGTAGITPGDTLGYTLNIAISDYFAAGQTQLGRGQFVITDQLSDGQTLTGTPAFTYMVAGVSHTVALVSRSTVNADGTTAITFDIGASIRAAGVRQPGALAGDLAFDNVLQGATTATVNYTAVVDQRYATTYAQSDLNEGDSIGNNATVTTTLLTDNLNLTGDAVTDESQTTSTIPTHNVDIAIVSVNGTTPPASGELNPGDVVTFSMTYNLVTGDYEQFQLAAYLPLPLLSLSGTTWSEGNGVGQWSLGAANTNAGAISVADASGNSLVFNFGSFATNAVGGSTIQVQFTLRVGDQPYADQRSLDVLAQSSQVTTIAHQSLVSSDVATIVSVAEPTLAIRQGVVSSSAGTVTGTTGTWSVPGSAGTPFSGSVTDLAAVDGNVSGIDAGDTLRLATAIENTGGGGAFDVSTSVALPTGLQFTGGSLAASGLKIYRGDGTLLVAGVDYNVSGNTVTFLDAGGVATLLPGRSGTTADTNGSNLVVITYDVTVDAGIPAASTLQTTAALNNYASVEGGTDFTPTDLTDTASEQVAAPTVSVHYAGGTLDNSDSSAPQTTGSDLVIGESMQYDIVVTLPEGSTQNLRIDDLIQAGMHLDTRFNGGLGYQLITTVAGSAALGADFNGTLSGAALSGLNGGTLGADGVGGQWSFSVSKANADNDAGNNSFVIRVQLVASDVAGNQAGITLTNTAQLVFSDPDGDTPNGTAAVDRTVAPTGVAPTVVIREPTLQVIQASASASTTGLGVDQGDTVEYDITLSNGTATTDFNAYDISFLDSLPAELSGLTFFGATYSGGATNNGGADFELVGGQLRTVSGANIDIATGGSITLRVSGTVLPVAASEPSFANTATVQWTSLDGAVGGTADPAGERTGVDGALNSGVLNDYRSGATLVVPVAQEVNISRVGGLPDTPAATPTDASDESVTVGEIVRYRVVAILAEGSTSDYTLQVTLQNGLGFINDGTTRLAFISNNGITTDIASLITGGTLNIVGNQASAQAEPITADLSGAAPTGVLNAADIVVTTDSNGNQVITFHLGNLFNGDSDPDKEGISLEFNARVLNQASNVGGTALSVSAADRSGTTDLSHSETVREDVVEPSITGMTKQIVSFNPTSATAGLGTAGVDISFTQSGGSPAYDVALSDSFPTGSNYTFDHLVLNGQSYAAAQLAGIGVTVDMSTGLNIAFAKLDAGAQVSVFYSASAPNTAAIAPSDATVTWTSLPDGFTTWGGSTVGATPGNSDGERTGSGVGPNTYIREAAAGLGVISGTLWDDTASATASSTPDGPGLAGQTVTLTWAGADGNLATTADNLVYTPTTDSNGQYHFGVLAKGTYQIQTPTGTLSYPQPVGTLAVRIDSDASTPLGTIGVTLADGGTAAANAGYVEQNDAPVNHFPTALPSGLEDTTFSLAGVTVSDVDAGTLNLQLTLSVLHGTLSLTALPAGVTETGANTAVLVLTGSQADLNTALANLQYLGNLNYNGTDTLTINTNDLGNFGDHDGDGIPGEPTDALTTQGTLAITVVPVNDPPVAVNDTASATEAGGNANTQPGVNPTGNVLTNDTDVDIATNGDALRVVTVSSQDGAQVLLPNFGGTVLTGVYGSLTIGANGGYQYTVDNGNAAVEALRLPSQTLTEVFTYTIFDTANASSTATLTVTIHGANDAPVGVDDIGSATEAGGVLNGTPGSDATGNVLTNDTDVDSAANGETKNVTGITNQPEVLVNSPLSAVTAGTTSGTGTGTSMVGTYGTLTIGADGTYRYVVDNNNPVVQSRVPSDAPLVDTFTYQLTDAGGLSDLAQLQIQVHGANDNPVASDDQATATAGSTQLGVNPVDPSGNVITTASRPGPIDQPGGNGIDTDVDHTDTPNTLLKVDGVRNGVEAASGALTAVASGTSAASGAVVDGSYGTLHIGADGSYTYDVDSSNASVRALAAGATLTETFTYEIVDTSGLTDRAQLVITVAGINDAPVAQNDTAQAREAGGVNNGTPGVDPTGNVLANDRDPEGDSLAVSAIRTGTESGSGTTGTLGQALPGQYGSLTLNADGTYTYVVDNSNAAVQALRLPTDQLVEHFTYTVTDPHGATDQAELDIVISGQNDTPVAQNDQASATEAGGTNNGTAGVNPTGNVLTNDIDVDAGDTKTVDGARSGSEAAGGAFAAVTGATSIAGTYGTLTLNPDGSYTYTVDNSLAALQALTPGQSVIDTFSYRMHDTAGAAATAQLTVQIQGAWDAPVANNDIAIAAADNGNGNAHNPTGNVLNNDTDVDAGDALTVTAARTGSEAAGGALAAVAAGTGSDSANASVLHGQYGDLVLGADGTYVYNVDTSNATLIALGPLQTVTDVFTYQATDKGGLSDVAQITIVVRGRNDPPVAGNDAGTAIEAGGIANGTPGFNPSGNVLSNDSDAEGDAIHVAAIRTGDATTTGATAGSAGSALHGTYGTLTLNADGTWNYVADNDSAAVQALRTSGQTLQDVFTYTVDDALGAQASAQLRITVDGQNDNPVANNDTGTAIEAGGVNNGTPGQDATGNVLANDTDVDSAANGETKTVVDVTNADGQSANAGAELAGRYGHLVVNADGNYDYVVDNANAAVESLRASSETLTEVFTYTMRDTAGATATTSLTITIHGADDAPVAHDDSNVASDQTPAPQATGNVLTNDTDVDANDHLSVVAIRTGEETGTGKAGAPGQALAGRYGTLVLNANGSYTYVVDLTNPQVLTAAGLGQVLHDPFTYTIRDDAGATDQAQLVINLDISAPYIPPTGGAHWDRDIGNRSTPTPALPFEPAVFITPVVERDAVRSLVSARETDGSQIGWPLYPLDGDTSIGAGLGLVPGEFVAQSVRASQLQSAFDRAWLFGQHTRTHLTADGLLPDPSLFAPLAEHLTAGLKPIVEKGPAHTAQSFVTQLRAAALKLPAAPQNTEKFVEH